MSDYAGPAETFPVGEFLREELEARGWSGSEFAQILGRPLQAVSEILNNRKEITHTTAVQIGDALGTSAELWLNLQTAHRLQEVRSRASSLSEVRRRARLRDLLPIREMRSRGWLPDTDDVARLETAVLEFLGTLDLDQEPQFLVAARRSNAELAYAPEQRAWLSRVRQVASQADVGPYDPDCLREVAESLARRLADASDLSYLGSWLGDCGVVLVVEQQLKSSKIDGVAMVLEDGAPVVGLSTRGNRFDSVVFTTLHELAHILEGHLNDESVYLDEDIMAATSVGEREVVASDLASMWIFPDGLSVAKPITTAGIVNAALDHGVHPSLVIGRLQYDGELSWNRLRAQIPKARQWLT